MNDDHADAVALYATKLLGAETGAWRVTGIDPDGLDLASGDTVLRLEFPQRVTAAGQLREVLAGLAKQARES
jgi:putative heme iron utilization protein